MSFQINNSSTDKRWLRPVLALLLCTLLAMSGQPALAQDPNQLTVNRTEDAVDAVPGNGVCDADANVKGLQCTLRTAIMEANTLAGAQTILLPTGNYRLTIAGSDEDTSRTGDLDITDALTIIGRGSEASIIDAAGLDRVLHITQKSGFAVQLQKLTLRGGVYVRGGHFGGGGLLVDRSVQVTIEESVITDNVADQGGGIHMKPGKLTLTSVRLQNNRARNGGGLSTFGDTIIRRSTISGNRAENFADSFSGLQGMGGGIDTNFGLTIERSTITGNSAELGGGGIVTLNQNSDILLTSSTLSGNTAPSGGAIHIRGALYLLNSTVAYNSSKALVTFHSSTIMGGHNSVIAHNGERNCYFASNESRWFGRRNIASDASCAFTTPELNLPNTDPLLAPLAFNGGESMTHALLPGSPAIEGGDNATCNLVDQRGVARPQGLVCDIGAVEGQG